MGLGRHFYVLSSQECDMYLCHVSWFCHRTCMQTDDNCRYVSHNFHTMPAGSPQLQVSFLPKRGTAAVNWWKSPKLNLLYTLQRKYTQSLAKLWKSYNVHIWFSLQPDWYPTWLSNQMARSGDMRKYWGKSGLVWRHMCGYVDRIYAVVANIDLDILRHIQTHRHWLGFTIVW